MINTCCNLYFYYNFIVHGGIRHLERKVCEDPIIKEVHGGIRHLEIMMAVHVLLMAVHGGIRHLEITTSCRNWF